VSKVACASCGFFVPPKKQPPEARADHPVFHFGQCKRFPQPVEKSPEDWCGEHTQFNRLEEATNA
jgi:hypothetical protein